jgi:hypothetical protein
MSPYSNRQLDETLRISGGQISFPDETSGNSQRFALLLREFAQKNVWKRQLHGAPRRPGSGSRRPFEPDCTPLSNAGHPERSRLCSGFSCRRLPPLVLLRGPCGARAGLHVRGEWGDRLEACACDCHRHPAGQLAEIACFPLSFFSLTDISGITDILPRFSPCWLCPITSFHHIGDNRCYRDILESVTGLTSVSFWNSSHLASRVLLVTWDRIERSCVPHIFLSKCFSRSSSSMWP